MNENFVRESHPPVIIKRERKMLKVKKVVSPSKGKERWIPERVNEEKFSAFAQDKPHQIIEKKISIPNFLLSHCPLEIMFFPDLFPEVFKIDSIFGDFYFCPLEISVDKNLVFRDGVYQEFYRHYQTKLQGIPNLNLGKEFDDFLKSYALKLNGEKRGAKVKETTNQFIEMAKRGLNASQIVKKLAEPVFEDYVKEFLAEGHSEKQAKFMAEENTRVWKLVREKRAREALRYHRFGKRNNKTAEKLSKNFLKQKKQN